MFNPRRQNSLSVCLQYYASPCGELILASMGSALCLCDWHDRPCAEHHLRRIIKQVHADFRVATSAVLELTKRQLDDYFAGRRAAFSIPLHPVGTDFQQRVWSALRSIPYGETRSYKHIAQSIGCQQGVRAVAQVNCAPKRSMASLSMAALSADTCECSLSRVPSRSLTYSVEMGELLFIFPTLIY